MTPLIVESNQNFDLIGRETQLRNIMAKLHDLAPSIFLYPHTVVIARKPSVENVVISSGGFMFERMHMTETAN